MREDKLVSNSEVALQEWQSAKKILSDFMKTPRADLDKAFASLEKVKYHLTHEMKDSRDRGISYILEAQIEAAELELQRLSQCFERDPYLLLSCSNRCNRSAIRKSFFILAKKYHPDKSLHTQRLFVLSQAAYEKLVNPSTRRIVDARLRHQNMISAKKWIWLSHIRTACSRISARNGSILSPSFAIKKSPNRSKTCRSPGRDTQHGAYIQYDNVKYPKSFKKSGLSQNVKGNQNPSWAKKHYWQEKWKYWQNQQQRSKSNRTETREKPKNSENKYENRDTHRDSNGNATKTRFSLYQTKEEQRLWESYIKLSKNHNKSKEKHDDENLNREPSGNSTMNNKHGVNIPQTSRKKSSQDDRAKKFDEQDENEEMEEEKRKEAEQKNKAAEEKEKRRIEIRNMKKAKLRFWLRQREEDKKRKERRDEIARQKEIQKQKEEHEKRERQEILRKKFEESLDSKLNEDEEFKHSRERGEHENNREGKFIQKLGKLKVGWWNDDNDKNEKTKDDESSGNTGETQGVFWGEQQDIEVEELSELSDNNSDMSESSNSKMDDTSEEKITENSNCTKPAWHNLRIKKPVLPFPRKEKIREFLENFSNEVSYSRYVEVTRPASSQNGKYVEQPISNSPTNESTSSTNDEVPFWWETIFDHNGSSTKENVLDVQEGFFQCQICNERVHLGDVQVSCHKSSYHHTLHLKFCLVKL